MTAGSIEPTLPLKPGNPYNTQVGHSGEPPAGQVTVPRPVLDRLPTQPPIDHYSVDNCAEVASLSRIVAAGSSINDVFTRTVRTKTGLPFPPCDNCEIWLPNQ